MNNLIGGTLGDYHIQAEIGRGGMGTVYRAVHVNQGYTVALKVLAPHLSRDPAIIRRFWDEYQTVRGLYHHNIVRVYEFGQDRGYHFIAAEYIAGQSLEQRLSRGWRLHLRETVDVVQQVAAALDAVHPRGVVHRDLKPSNVLLERGGRVVLTDFGIASIVGGQAGLTRGGAWWGTPAYMSPEQARGDAHVTHRADIYALGVMTYRMLTGRVPFQREQPVAVLYAQIRETPPPLRAVAGGGRIPQAVEGVVMQALRKDPNSRPQRAGDFARQLARRGRARVPTPRPHPHPTPAGPLDRNGVLETWPMPALVGAAGLVVIVLLLVALLVPQLGPSDSRGSQAGLGTLAYVCQRGEGTHICIRADATDLFSVGTHDWTPVWSPDGEHIALASDRGGSTGIWVLEPESSEAYSLAVGEHDASSPSWSPDGKSIAFDVDVGGNYDIYLQQVGGTTPTRLTRGTAQDSDPSWSPDGDRIAFVSERDGDLEIYLMDTQGKNVTRLTDHTGWDFAPVWSPDGRQIAYECADDAGGDVEICVMDAEGYNRRVLTDNTVDDRQPAWSPDGRQITFCRERSGGSLWDIWVMGVDGARQRVWIQDDHSNTHPAWKP